MSRPTFSDSADAHDPPPARTHAVAEPSRHPAHSVSVGTESVRSDSPGGDSDKELEADLPQALGATADIEHQAAAITTENGNPA
jgi:hypothetical protein